MEKREKMGIEVTVKAFEKKGYAVKHFAARQEAVVYLKDALHGKAIGFGGYSIHQY